MGNAPTRAGDWRTGRMLDGCGGAFQTRANTLALPLLAGEGAGGEG